MKKPSLVRSSLSKWNESSSVTLLPYPAKITVPGLGSYEKSASRRRSFYV